MSTFISMQTNGLNAPDKITDSQKVTAGYFSDSVGKLVAAKIHSGSLSAANEKYYFAITNTPSASGVTQMTVAYGNVMGSGSNTDSDDINGPTEAVYKQWANTLLGENEATGGFKISRGDGSYTTPTNAKVGLTRNAFGGNPQGRDESVFVLVGKRARFKDRLNKKNWTLVLSGSDSTGGSQYASGSFIAKNSPALTSSVDEIKIGDVEFMFVPTASAFRNTATQIFISKPFAASDRLINTASIEALRDSVNNSASLHNLRVTASVSTTTAGGKFSISGSLKGSYANYTLTSQSLGQIADGNDGWCETFLGMQGGAGTAGAKVLHLTDDSGDTTTPTFTVAGPRYNIVSGSNGNVSGSGKADRVYGWIYPESAVMVFSGTELSASIPGQAASSSTATLYNNDDFKGFGVSNTVKAANYKNALRFINCLKTPGAYMQFRSEEDLTSTHYFCRFKAAQMNFSNNPTFVSGTANEIRHTSMQGNPTVFISGIGLYSGDGTLAAIGKLSTPLKKNFSTEGTVKVKLDW